MWRDGATMGGVRQFVGFNVVERKGAKFRRGARGSKYLNEMRSV
jgi:hypothetical protein